MGDTIDFHATPKSTSQQDVYRPAVEEIQRRGKAAEAFDPTAEQHFPLGPMPLTTPVDQKYVLLSIGTRVMAPRPVDPLFPSMRIYGCFYDKQEAAEHAEVVREKDERCSLIVLKCGEWFLFPQSEETLRDPKVAEERLQNKIEQHRNRQDEEGQAFEDAIHKNKDRKVNWNTSDWSQEQEEVADAENEVYRRPRRLRAGAEVRGQNVCAFCIVPDPIDGEVAVKVLGCFDGAAEADAWVQNVASRQIATDDILVASTCEWIYPNGGKEKTDCDRYRIRELQTIMDAARANPQNVRNFKEWKREQDRLKVIEHKKREEAGEQPDPDRLPPLEPQDTSVDRSTARGDFDIDLTQL